MIKFVPMASRGGKYLVVASNIAYLRTHENGQTKVGLVGGDSLQVDGAVEDIARLVTG